ncbi:hypothetical protein PCANC_13958 [Puccinia coronata f. sp. avenae]|uniref:HMG box domain-containing protein n=1 Tax=Puccinia coronata f. sp. avenae TaxID=200324 RepID=A0A2N5UGF2_9BASI|nr:hypothetical protein PCANC_13958 [Puccinia coronata f. sp. avenae]
MAHLMTPESKPAFSRLDPPDFHPTTKLASDEEHGSKQISLDLIAGDAKLQSTNQGSVVKKKEEKLPRPPNSWILYRSDKIAEMKSQHSGLAQCLLSKEIATRWHSESQEVRNNYEKKAELIKAEHAIKYPDYKYSPKRRKPADSHKDGQKKITDPSSPLQKSKRKESSSSADSRSSSSRSKKGKASRSTDDMSPKQESTPKLNEGNNPDLIHPDELEADLYSAYPLLGKLAQAHDTQAQRVIATGDYRKIMSTIEAPSAGISCDHRFSAPAAYAGLSPDQLPDPRQPLHHFPSQGLIQLAQPPPQPRREWLDFSRLDPQLQLLEPSTSNWTTANTTDISPQPLPSSSPSMLFSSNNPHQPPTPNPGDFGFFQSGEDFNAMESDWMNPDLQSTMNGSFFGPPFGSCDPAFEFNHDHNPVPDDLLESHSTNPNNLIFPTYPFFSSH